MAKKKAKKPVKSKKVSKKNKGKKVKKHGKKKKGGFGGLIIAVVIILAVIVVAKLKGGDPVKYIKAEKIIEFGSAGEKTGQMNGPRGLAVSKDGVLYVADLQNNRVDKFKLNGESAGVVGEKGEKKGQFKEPSGVAVDKDNNLYVADAWNGRIQKFDSKGRFVLEVGGEKAGFYSPRNVAVNDYGMVHVADTGTSRIHRFDTDGNRIGKPFGERGKALGNFQEVFGLAFDSKKRVYVGDPGNMRVAVLSGDLKPEASIRVKGWETAKPMWPMVAVDSRDYLYAVSSGTQEIWVYDTKNPKFKYVGTIKTDSKGKNLFGNPLGIAIDAQDNIYISEVTKNTIIKIRPVFE
ncbi:MAG: Serine/threonine-protein kinase PknD [Candidatus Aerophobetes bacterium ADurb.Bin490]|nr:MAG: Serine/threonine-protein kinase PknD [Candidatus Aerophobetes bacterium ADurb.Bin490]HNZ28736.1 NHL repeat-containing protein [Candidatus Goldiibacteriota bacterium]